MLGAYVEVADSNPGCSRRPHYNNINTGTFPETAIQYALDSKLITLTKLMLYKNLKKNDLAC